jgi:hypothetical protein
MPDMINEHDRELIAGYALRSLAPDEMERVAAMVAEDPQLQALLNDYQSVMVMIAEPVSGKAPPGLKAKILDSIAERSPQAKEVEQPILSAGSPQAPT